MNQEIQLYEQIAQYMNLQYPGIPYHFDLSGLWTPSHKARNLYGRLNKRAWPDLFIAHYYLDKERFELAKKLGEELPNTLHQGLFLELKREGTVLYKKDGTLRANPHHEEQAAVLQGLRNQGYKAEFAVGFEQSKQMIDSYLQ